jgi:hypothetical protein
MSHIGSHAALLRTFGFERPVGGSSGPHELVRELVSYRLHGLPLIFPTVYKPRSPMRARMPRRGCESVRIARSRT